MTARELLFQQIQKVGNQLVQATRDLDAEAAEARANPAGMTIREQMVHLAEAAVATRKAFAGETHEWGTWQPADRSWNGVREAWRAERSAAIDALPESEDALLPATEFLILHDAYHVGQIAIARLDLYPEWNGLSLYDDPDMTEQASL